MSNVIELKKSFAAYECANCETDLFYLDENYVAVCSGCQREIRRPNDSKVPLHRDVLNRCKHEIRSKYGDCIDCGQEEGESFI